VSSLKLVRVVNEPLLRAWQPMAAIAQQQSVRLYMMGTMHVAAGETVEINVCTS